MKKRKKKNSAPGENLPTLPFFAKKESGKIQKESTVVYSFTLPCLSAEKFKDCMLLLDQIKEAFLSFLEKESKKKREETFLGTLSFQARENQVTLLSSFSPFEEKNEEKVAVLIFSPEGELVEIKK